MREEEGRCGVVFEVVSAGGVWHAVGVKQLSLFEFVDRGRRAGQAISHVSAVGATSANIVAADLRGSRASIVCGDESEAIHVDCGGARLSSALANMVACRGVAGGAEIGAEVNVQRSVLQCGRCMSYGQL